jgi:hypothetical protein
MLKLTVGWKKKLVQGYKSANVSFSDSGFKMNAVYSKYESYNAINGSNHKNTLITQT